MKCRNFIWGRVRRSEKIIHKIQTTPSSLSIFPAHLRDWNSKGLNTKLRGGLGHSALQHLTEKKMVYLHSKGVQEKRKALLRSTGFFCHSTPDFITAMKDVQRWGIACGVQKCPSTNTRHQPMSKHSKQKATADPGKMEGEKKTPGLMPRSIHEPVGLVLNKREQMFTGLHWLVEMGTTEVILHSKFCSKLN